MWQEPYSRVLEAIFRTLGLISYWGLGNGSLEDFNERDKSILPNGLESLVLLTSFHNLIVINASMS